MRTLVPLWLLAGGPSLCSLPHRPPQHGNWLYQSLYVKKEIESSSRQKVTFLCNLTTEVTYHYFCPFFLLEARHWVWPMFIEKGFLSGMSTRSQGTLEAVLEAACHSLQVFFFFSFLPVLVFLCAFGRLCGGRFTLRPWYFVVLSHNICYWHFFSPLPCYSVYILSVFLSSFFLDEERGSGCTHFVFYLFMPFCLMMGDKI